MINLTLTRVGCMVAARSKCSYCHSTHIVFPNVRPGRSFRINVFSATEILQDFDRY